MFSFYFLSIKIIAITSLTRTANSNLKMLSPPLPLPLGAIFHLYPEFLFRTPEDLLFPVKVEFEAKVFRIFYSI